MKKQANIAIVGRPNVGKSTLLNHILNEKVAIVSYKPQTTRNLIKAIYEDDKMKITFVDTPGYHNARNKLDQFLNSQVKNSFKQTDYVLFLLDSTQDINEEDIKIGKLLEGYEVNNYLLVFTKKDIAKKNIDFEAKIAKLELTNKPKFIQISNNSPEDVRLLLETIEKNVVNNLSYTSDVNANDDFIISELIREQLLINLKQEVPHASAVIVENKKYDEKTKIFHIDAAILVEKNTQKPIIIGKNGSMIKTIGTKSRMELLKVFDCKINLKLFVKVEKEWRDNQAVLKQLGYYK